MKFLTLLWICSLGVAAADVSHLDNQYLPPVSETNREQTQQDAIEQEIESVPEGVLEQQAVLPSAQPKQTQTQTQTEVTTTTYFPCSAFPGYPCLPNGLVPIQGPTQISGQGFLPLTGQNFYPNVGSFPGQVSGGLPGQVQGQFQGPFPGQQVQGQFQGQFPGQQLPFPGQFPGQQLPFPGQQFPGQQLPFPGQQFPGQQIPFPGQFPGVPSQFPVPPQVPSAPQGPVIFPGQTETANRPGLFQGQGIFGPNGPFGFISNNLGFNSNNGLFTDNTEETGEQTNTDFPIRRVIASDTKYDENGAYLYEQPKTRFVY